MKRLLIVSLFFIFASIDIFAQSKPDSNAVFNYYVACATGDVKNAKNFLTKIIQMMKITIMMRIVPSQALIHSLMPRHHR